MYKKKKRGKRDYFYFLASIILIITLFFTIINNNNQTKEIVLKNPLPPEQLPRVITFWGEYIDVVSDSNWPDILSIYNNLSQIGFTHAGIKIWSNNSNVSTRIADLRNNNLKFAFIDVFDSDSRSRRILLNDVLLDPLNHSSNNQNLKYFDTVGFDPYVCVNSPNWNCTIRPRNNAHDPAYTGVVWQTELSFLNNLLDQSTITFGDVALFDIEIWVKPSGVEYYYPNAITNSYLIYSGNQSERFSQYESNWKARGKNIANLAKIKSSNILTLFYGENLPEIQESGNGEMWMLPGTGDAPSPDFYWSPNLTKVEYLLNTFDYSNSYPWISFAYSRYNYNIWDPKITQKLGFLLKQEGVKGIIVYPGPGDHNDSLGLTKEEAINYYYNHSKALMLGFVRGIDPDNPPPSCTQDSNCSDTLFCNGEEKCLDGYCDVGIPVNINDNYVCTQDNCDENTDTIIHTLNDSYCSLNSLGSSCNPASYNNLDGCGTPPENNNNNDGGSPGGPGSPATPQCRDGRDNDNDGKIDYPNDAGCLSRDDNSEINTIIINGSCIENWECTNYGLCLRSIQIRSCEDTNNCNTFTRKPLLEKLCTDEDSGNNEDDENNNILKTISLIILPVLTLGVIVAVIFTIRARKINNK